MENHNELLEALTDVHEYYHEDELHTDAIQYAIDCVKRVNVIDELLAEYKRLESKNYHGEAVALLVNFFGTEDEKNVIDGINASHENRGRLTDLEYDKRNKLSRKYFRLLNLLTK